MILDRLDEPVIFLPPGTVGLKIPPRIQGAVDRARRVDRGTGLDIRYRDEDGLGLRYTAVVSTGPDRAFAETLEPELRQRYLELPDGVERVAELARTVTASAQTDRERAMAIQTHLRDSGEYTYSLEMPPVEPAESPLDVFLFEARYGHCEYYSTAMAVMLRTLGVPTRNVTGFAGAVYNPYGDYYAVRQGDAHSWVEAYVDERWITFDPTPPARGDLGAADGLLTDFRAIMDAIRTRWNRDVVGYDMRSQVESLRRFFRWSWRIRNQLRGGADDADAEPAGAGSGSSDRLAPLLGGAIVLLSVLAIGWVALRRRRRRRRARQRLSADGESAVRLYRSLERALSKRGQPRPAERTPREHADQLRAEGFAGADVVDEVTRRYEASRWGGDALPAEELARLEGKIAAIMRAPSP